MPFYPLDAPPGMYRNGTEYQSQGRWYDGAGVRFINKTIRPVGGWLKLFASPVDGPGRGMVAWRRNTGVTYCAVGTPNKLWVFDSDTLTDITPDFFDTGVPDTIEGIGFGSGRYGAGPFGSSSGGAGRTSATMWSLQAWGDHLLAMATHDQVLYEWDGTLTDKAAPVANAPTGVAFLVTEEEIVMVLGAGDDQRDIQWSDIQNNTLWTPAPDNNAGEHHLVTDGAIVTGFRVTGGNLILTTCDVHLAEFTGDNQVYRFTRKNTGCGIVGVRAGTAFQNGNAVWMGDGNFWLFDGVSVRVLPCEVADYVFGDFDSAQAAKAYCGTTQKFGEITWHYPSSGSLVNDRTVTWNFIENTWALNGQPARSSWLDDDVFPFPMAVANDGTIYNHEDGWTADGVSRAGTIFLRSGPVEVGNGDQVIYATKVLPDETTAGAWAIRFATRFAPEAPEWPYGPYTLTPFADVRLAGRQVAIAIESVIDGDLRIGRFRVEGTTGGRR